MGGHRLKEEVYFCMQHLNLLSQAHVAYQEIIHFKDYNVVLSTNTLYALKNC